MLAVLRRSPNHRDAARRKRELEILAGVRRAPPVHAAWRRKGSARAAPVEKQDLREAGELKSFACFLCVPLCLCTSV
jgi:hypothetical protein